MAFGLETGPDTVVNIKVIGVGGAGNNAVDARLARALAEIALARLVGRAPFVETF